MITIEPTTVYRCTACPSRVDCLSVTLGDPNYGTVGVTLCRACLADLHRLTAPAPPALTVGAALTDPRVQDGSHVVEYAKARVLKSAPFFMQVRLSPTRTETEWRHPGVDSQAWWRGPVTPTDYPLACRLVSLADADISPDARGPIAATETP